MVIAESGPATANSGRVSVVNSAGVRRTLLAGLPSGLFGPANDPDGPTGLLLDGNTLYITIGEGDLFRNGTVAGTTVINPAGIASPILDTVLQVDFPQSVDRLTSTFTLTPLEQGILFDGGTVTLSDGANSTATVSVLSHFRFRPDPVVLFKNSHPYGLAKLASDPNHLYMVDAGLNSLVKIDLPSGRARTIVRFPPIPNPTAIGGPFIDPVPDSIHAYGDYLLVSYLTGFPFVQGGSRIVFVDPATGNSTPFINFMTSSIDIAFRDRPSGRPQFFVLQYSTNQRANPAVPGQVVVFNDLSQSTLVGGLHAPTSLALDAAGGMLYITSRTDGTVLRVNVGL